MNRRRKGISPIAASLIGIALLAIGVYFAFTKAIPFESHYTINAVVRNSNLLAPGSPVRIGGVDVGKVTGVGRYRDTNLGLVQMQISGAGTIHEDATIHIRPRLFLEGNFYVDLSAGDSRYARAPQRRDDPGRAHLGSGPDRPGARCPAGGRESPPPAGDRRVRHRARHAADGRRGRDRGSRGAGPDRRRGAQQDTVDEPAGAPRLGHRVRGADRADGPRALADDLWPRAGERRTRAGRHPADRADLGVRQDDAGDRLPAAIAASDDRGPRPHCAERADRIRRAQPIAPRDRAVRP